MRGEIQYIRDVLGVETWIAPLSEALVPRPNVLAVFKSEWNAPERAFAEKILSSLGTPIEITTQDASTLGDSHLLVFDSNEAVGRIQTDDQVIWHLGRLSALMSGPPADVQNAKRQVWNLLKNLKDEI